jgi:hypothetical protein
MFWFIVILLLAGAGFYFYQKMMDIEREIRAEQEAAQASASVPVEPSKKKSEPEPESASDPPIVTPEVEKMTAKATPVADESLSLEGEVLAAVKNLQGVKQTELYGSFTDVGKKQLQQLLKELDDSGKIKREKKGSSYLLYPV